jgi:sarcosine oxidase subunit gamma
MADTAAILRRVALTLQLGLRGDGADPRFAAAIAGALGCPLPTVPNTVSRAGAIAVLWLAPDEFLVTAESGSAGLTERLRDAVAGQHAAVVDLSASRIVFELAGEAARHVLAKGCSLDLHPRAFASGACAQTALARAAVILQQVDDVPHYRVFVRRSFARYLEAWLRDAAAEFAGTATP